MEEYLVVKDIITVVSIKAELAFRSNQWFLVVQRGAEGEIFVNIKDDTPYYRSETDQRPALQTR